MTTTTPDVRIRELLPLNLFAVFSERSVLRDLGYLAFNYGVPTASPTAPIDGITVIR